MIPLLKIILKMKRDLAKEYYSRYYWFFLLFLPFLSSAQLANRNWFFGDKAGLDFYYSNPILTAGKTSNTGSSAVFTDQQGVLWLYSDGLKIWNAAHQELIAGLNGDPAATQPAIFVPDPADSNLVYLFTSQTFGGNISVSHFQFRPFFQILSLNQMLIPSASEKLHGIKIPNKQSYLIFSHEWNSNRFVHWKMDSTGFYGPFYQNIGAYHGTPGGYNAKGWLKISQNGKYLASNMEYNGQFELFNLDLSTGNLSNPRSLSIQNPYGLAFSPSENFVYLTNQFFATGGVRNNQVWQISTNNLSKTLVGSWTGDAFSPDYIIGAIQNGLDGRLYIAKESHHHLARILYPEKSGVNCQFELMGQDLFGKFSRRGLPNILAQDLIPPLADFSFTDNICQGKSSQLQAISTQQNLQFQWQITGPSGTFQSNQAQWNPVFDSLGTHTILLTVQLGTSVQSIQKQIRVLPNPKRNFDPTYTLCLGDTLQLFAGNPGATYYWSNGYSSPSIIVTHSGTVKLRVYYQAGTCDSIFETKVYFVPKPQFNIPDTMLCHQNYLDLTAPLTGNYLWSTQQNTSSVRLEQSGNYWLEINQGSCSFRDSFQVIINQASEKELDTLLYFCPGNRPFFIIQAKQSASYEWNTGETDDFIMISDTGLFWVKRINSDGCMFIDSFEVKYNCQSPFFPNSFTPQGKNPIFKAISTDWIQGNLIIYNRWGQKIFEGEAWNGEHAHEGTYTYIWKGVNGQGEKMEKVGTVLLIR